MVNMMEYRKRKQSRPAPTGYTPEQLEQRRVRKRHEKARLARANFIPVPRSSKPKVPKPHGVAFFTKPWTAARIDDARKQFNIPTQEQAAKMEAKRKREKKELRLNKLAAA